MVYTELLKLCGSLLRWSLKGFKGEFKDYYDEKFEKSNFIAGCILILIVMIILIPLISIILI
jgi:hypothetical protein